MAPRSVTIALRPGIVHAQLPDNRDMIQGHNYTIGYDDWGKISRASRESVVSVVSFNDGHLAVNGTDLTVDSVSVPAMHKLGEVVQGFDGAAFKLVKLVDGVAASAGSAATWSDKTAAKVTVDRAGGTSTGEFAGIFNSSVTAGRYAWLQTEGTTEDVLSTANCVVGEPVTIDPTADKLVTGNTLEEIQTITLTNFTSSGVHEVQKLDFGDISTADVFKLQSGGAGGKTAEITYSADMSATLQSELRTLTGDTGLTVAKNTVTTYTVTWATYANEPALNITDIGNGGADFTAGTPFVLVAGSTAGEVPDSFKVKVVGDASAKGPMVRGTSAAASDVLAALESTTVFAPGDITVTGATNAGPFVVTAVAGGAFENLDMPTISVDSPVGCTGAVVTTKAGGTEAGTPIGTALTTAAGGTKKIDLELRSARVSNRHNRTRDLFYPKGS